MLQFLDANFFDVRVHVRRLFFSSAFWNFVTFCTKEMNKLVHISSSPPRFAATEDETKQRDRHGDQHVSSSHDAFSEHANFVSECVLRACFHSFERYYRGEQHLSPQVSVCRNLHFVLSYRSQLT